MIERVQPDGVTAIVRSLIKKESSIDVFVGLKVCGVCRRVWVCRCGGWGDGVALRPPSHEIAKTRENGAWDGGATSQEEPVGPTRGWENWALKRREATRGGVASWLG